MTVFAALVALFLFCFSFHPFVFADDPKADVVIAADGVSATIRGYNHSYGLSFRGIRYAKAPLGDLRFKEAQRNDPQGLIEALGYGYSCVQGNGQGNSEDCLFLNVFSPIDTTSSSKLPVYVYIHGGGFVQGSGNMGAGMYPNLINPGKIVLVSINYRLGPFGFFSTRDSMASGNWAISDWVEALNWVQRYISFFGGDPKTVTIGGQSSGGEAVSALSLTPLATGLFNRMIIESGSAFGAAVMSYSEKTRNTSAQLSIRTQCASQETWGSGSDFGPILNCLRSLTSDQIVQADNALPGHRMKWSLVQDKKWLPQRLEYLALNRPPYPVLIGDVHDEWLAWEIYDIVNNLNSNGNSKTGLLNSLATSYEMTYWDNEAAVLYAANNKYIYSQNLAENDHVDWMAQRIKLYSEMVFIGPVLRDARYFSYTKSPVYLYSFDYLSPLALPQITEPKLRGVQHAWELQYIFDTNCDGFTCQVQDNQIRSYMGQTWVNFIKQGNPVPSGSSLPFKWLPMDSSNRYLSIMPTPFQTVQYHADSWFWVCTAPTIDGFKAPFC
ncbi:unnamed protein product [Caenorhabditis auriculariae]|uniref:Carboxylic ester hydrolase n=1 Tax=Caenorhabditis auriculariae TaxID=2777116 RepID=A0A8S1GVG9_9PELO|nr:unnamed protein product [Caenorhabditis auriculariae]